MKMEVRTLQGVEQIIDAMAVTEKAARKVAVRALNDTAKWFKSNAGKEIAKETGVPSAFVKKRFFITKAVAQELDSPLCATISVNLYDVRPPHLGALQKTSSGAKAGKFTFGGAFIATMNKKRGPSLYKRKGKELFPVSEMGVDIKTKAEPILERLVNEAPAVYEKRFQSQMNYEASKGNAL
ncbi:hypothetical protein AGMMS49949_01520 [Alphaproteobacteria bacterium]|nr:hypothetical protein AGMMS49949_01520 [Alphaproteobacteria bacterium]